MSRRLLKLAVFLSGMSVMSVEMAASRLLAPWFGTALTVWTSLIGLIMVALTVGYSVGGRLADKRPEVSLFYKLLLGGGVLIGSIPFVSDPILGATLGASRIGVMLGSFLGVALLFAVPIGMLGMISPFAIRLVAEDREHAGQAAGSIYALSTAGSIVGTFLPGFVLIPLMGTKGTILLFGGLLAVMGGVGLGSAPLAVGAAASALLVGLFVSPVKEIPGLIHARESLYNYIQVVQRTVEGAEPRTRNLLVLNEGRAVHSVYDPDSPIAPLVGSVWDFMNAPVLLADQGEAMRGAVVGLAAGTVPHQWIRFFADRDMTVDGAEIDPGILEVAREYFGVGVDEEAGKLRTFAQDGRMFLRRQVPGSYDVVLTDAYKQPYIPFHLATTEYFELVRSRLKDTGVMAINVGAIDVESAFFRRLLSSVAAVFGEVRYVLVRNYGVPFNNHVVIAGKGPLDWSRLDPARNPRVAEIAARRRNPSFQATMTLATRNLHRFEGFRPDLVFTDDRAPVEFYTEKMMVDYLAAGGGIPDA